MPNYSKSIIYKLCCKNPNITDIYVGSTTNFKSRKYQHKCTIHHEANEGYETKKSKFIRENGGIDNWDMILIKEFSCENKRQMLKIEREVIDELKPTLNSNMPYRSDEEKAIYFQINKKIIEKKYREKNKEIILKKKKIYREKNKDKISLYNKIYREKKNSL
jgi:hypothetical protein